MCTPSGKTCAKWFSRVVFGFSLVALIYLVPLLEFLKIVYFEAHSSVVSLANPVIEVIYLALSIPFPITLIWVAILRKRCSLDLIREKIIEQLCFVPLYMIVISIAYTHYTVDELSVPFFCPTSYNYTSPEIHTACVIRDLNLFVMWMYTILLILSIFAWCCGFLPSEEDFYFKEKFLASTGLSSLSFGGSSTWGSTRSATWGHGQGQGSSSKVVVTDEENPFGKNTDVKSADNTNPFLTNNESDNIIIKSSYVKGEKE
ncbi:hypothetical protein Glove_78g59 [Diversispora epigaea]|uniref:Uncharacterized protein n=1 Tax=Diversispora epigaea TaxID=1348612 RepID=A0A397JJF6_9GLOM|nr:hypothetical protein Glove_78g59 [Diversispora epigaea]